MNESETFSFSNMKWDVWRVQLRSAFEMGVLNYNNMAWHI